MNDLPKALGRRLRSIREAKLLSQEALASISGLHRTYIGACERGERNLTIKSLKKITDSLGITLEDFFVGFR